MKRRTALVAIPVFLAAFLGINSCKTSAPVPVLSEPLVQKTADLTISLRYLSEAELIERYGRNDPFEFNNPYYGYPAFVTKKRLIVFDFRATTEESTVEFALDETYLEVDKASGTAKSRQYMTSIWEHYDTSNMAAIERTLKKTILDREFSVAPGAPVSGYLVFGENYPEEGGDGLITFRVSTPSGDQGEVEIPLQFGSDSVDTDGSGDTGIFAEN